VPYVGRRNLIINGAMQVAQRGDYTSATSAAVSAYYLDRYKTWLSTVTADIQQTTVSINGVTKNAYKITATSSGTGYIGFFQVIELQNIPVGETVTVSAWVRSNNSYARLRTTLNGGTSTDSPNTHTGGGDWEKLTFTVDTTGLASNPFAGVVTYDGATVPVSSGDYIEFTDFQVEVGSVATPFEHRSYGEELALCQRYYVVLTNCKGGGCAQGRGTGYSRYYAHSWTLPVEMRTNPDILQNIGFTSDHTGVRAYHATTNQYWASHGNTSALYSYWDGDVKLEAEL